MLFQQLPKPATAGTNYIVYMLPVGSTLKKVNANNATKAWQKCTILVGKKADGTGEGIALIHWGVQAGNRDLSWEGELTIEAPAIYIVAVFYGADLNDTLTLTVGYELGAPKEKRAWWR